MVVRQRAAIQGNEGGSSASTGGGRRGLLLGASINTTPSPPAQHFLKEDIKIEGLPLHHLPKRHIRFSEFMKDISSLMLMAKPRTEKSILSEVYDTILHLLQAISPRSQSMIEELSLGNPAFRRHCSLHSEDRRPLKGIRHPYDLLSAIKLIPTLLGKVYGEKYILELYTSVVLVEYIKKLRENPLHSQFLFSKEAVEFFQEGHRLEQSLTKVTDSREKTDIVNSIYQRYYHAKWYYCFSVIAREPPINDGKLFMCAFHAMHFLSMVRSDGVVLNKPKINLLPKRYELSFYLKRDGSVSSRIGMDPSFAKKVSEILITLPDR
ncbi:MAG: hypothetical protein WCJ64_05560 [Rhodospirillaceae bacterium]